MSTNTSNALNLFLHGNLFGSTEFFRNYYGNMNAKPEFMNLDSCQHLQLQICHKHKDSIIFLLCI